jgi:hypothetical protein
VRRSNFLNLGGVLALRWIAIIIGFYFCVLGVGSSHGSVSRDRASLCGGVDNMGGGAQQVRLLRGPAPVVLTEVLGVLREAQTEVDELPESAFARLGFSEVWVNAVRHLATSAKWGMRAFLVPGVGRAETCAPERPQTRAGAGKPLVMLDVYQPGGRVGARAYSVEEVLAGRLVSIYPLPAGSRELVLGVVPDGVSTVEVKAGDMPAQAAQVTDNFFEVEAPVPMGKGPANAVSSVTTTMTWYDQSGKSLKTVSHTEQRMFLLRAQADIPET